MSGMAQIAVSLDTWKAIEAARLSLGESHDEIVRRLACAGREGWAATVVGPIHTDEVVPLLLGQVAVGDLAGVGFPGIKADFP